MNILDMLKGRRLYFDGGTGSELIAKGLPSSEPSEEASFSHPDWVLELHRAYIAAGANIIKTNTFGVSSLKYENYTEYITRAISLANEARGDRDDVFVAFDMGPLGRMLAPLGDLAFSDAIEIFAKSVRAIRGLPVDAILIETMNDSYETRAAVLAAKENSDLPVFVTNVYDGSCKTVTGSTPEAMANMLEALGVDAIGANCSFGPREMLPVAERLVASTDLPVIINPNAGLPKIIGERTVYSEKSDTFSDVMVEMCRIGVSVLGGCCGTTPEYIRATARKTAGLPYPLQEEKQCARLSHPSKSESLDKAPDSEEINKSLGRISSAYQTFVLGDKPLLIGERINPTGKAWLKDALRNNQNSKILAEAIKQEETGISAIDVNCGLPNIDEKAKLSELVGEIQSVVSLPIVIDSGNPEAIASAIRLVNGVPIINSVNGSEESMAAILPIAKKYGAMLICLTMDESGIPESAEERVTIAERIKDRAEKLGIRGECLIFDPLALSVSTNEDNAAITLAAIKELTRRGMMSSLGVSNISFGMPNREKINSSFFRLALGAGLSLAIMNPESEEMMSAYRDFMAVRNDESTLSKFIADAEHRFESALREAREISASGAERLTKKVTTKTDSASHRYSIVKGLREDAALLARSLLSERPPMELINSEIIPALEAVGEAFDKKEIFLPSLLLSAEAAASAFDEIKKKIQRGESRKGRIVMATVKGDIHDIGKNIVRVVLESWGFEVTDLGRDVPCERILYELERGDVTLVGLSALMTTTLPAMADTVSQIKEKFPKVKVMVGGAVLTREYAEKIGADFYGKDAPTAAKIANSLV